MLLSFIITSIIFLFVWTNNSTVELKIVYKEIKNKKISKKTKKKF